MGDEEDRSSVLRETLDPAEAFSLEGLISNRQDVIHEENVAPRNSWRARPVMMFVREPVEK